MCTIISLCPGIPWIYLRKRQKIIAPSRERPRDTRVPSRPQLRPSPALLSLDPEGKFMDISRDKVTEMSGRTGKTPQQLSHKNPGSPSLPSWAGACQEGKRSSSFSRELDLPWGQIPAFPHTLRSLGISLRIPPSSTSAPINPSQPFIHNSLARGHSCPGFPHLRA